jgi:hypothetical protein
MAIREIIQTEFQLQDLMRILDIIDKDPVTTLNAGFDLDKKKKKKTLTTMLLEYVK